MLKILLTYGYRNRVMYAVCRGSRGHGFDHWEAHSTFDSTHSVREIADIPKYPQTTSKSQFRKKLRTNRWAFLKIFSLQM